MDNLIENIQLFYISQKNPPSQVHLFTGIKNLKALPKPLIKKIITYNVRKQSIEVQIKSLLRCIPSKHTFKIHYKNNERPVSSMSHR